MKNTALRNALVTLGSFIFVVSIVSAEPWKAPTGAPPTNNVSAPITIGADQIKSGALQLAALKSLGGVQIGTTTAACKSQPPEENTSGTLRWYKGVMEYCNGTAWVPFGGGGGASSPYCAYKGKSVSAGGGWGGPACSFSVDNAYTPTISINGYQFMPYNSVCSNSMNSVSVGCSGGDLDTAFISAGASFDLQTGVLTCTNSVNGSSGAPVTGTITPNPSLCTSGGGGTETDPTVVTHVKDGVDWSEITNKPSSFAPSGTLAGNCLDSNPWGAIYPFVAGPQCNTCASGWTRVQTGSIPACWSDGACSGVYGIHSCVKN